MKARIETPSGYHPVYQGKVRAGDRRFSPAARGRSCWGLVHKGDCVVGAAVEGFYAIIRPIPRVRKPVPSPCSHACLELDGPDGYNTCTACGAKFHWTDPEMQKE